MNDIQAGKKKSSQLKSSFGIPRPLRAIRLKCIECCGHQVAEVRRCHISECHLWAYRFGRAPKPEELAIPVLDAYGNIVGEEGWEGFGKGAACDPPD